MDTYPTPKCGKWCKKQLNVIDCVRPKQLLTTVMTRIVVDRSTDHAKPHSICFFTIISTSKKFFFQSASWKSIAWRNEASSVVWMLIDNGKLANWIARLQAIVVKSSISSVLIKNLLPHSILTRFTSFRNSTWRTNVHVQMHVYWIPQLLQVSW